MSDALLVFNGIDGSTGGYVTPALSPKQIAKVARGQRLPRQHLSDLEERKSIDKRKQGTPRGLKAGSDPMDLAQAGWGVIFPYGVDPAIKDALGELLQHRRQQAAQKNERYYQEYTGEKAYRPSEGKTDFLARQGAGPGPADPDKVPYYLLIVGGPDVIPYTFQYQLDVQYAVGRIHFDTPAEYAQYAHSVVAAESGQVSRPKRAAFFATENPGDEATNQSAEHLAKPLAQKVAAKCPAWQVQSSVQEEATKARLAELLGGPETPALLFTASHGMSFPNGDARQLPHQGALLCQDWPGPTAWKGPIGENFYFAGDDVAADAQVHGLIAFHFACYGAGTPLLDEFAAQAFRETTQIAARAFVANLPRRLLAHPKGGALAVIGHVERAWGYSFQWERAGDQTTAFESALEQLMGGKPVGLAMEFFNERYAELASDLTEELAGIKMGKIANEYALASMWTAQNDARSYVIVGDPAVRLAVS